jgi:chromosome partitioning protein
MAKVHLMVSQKGGVGKSLIGLNLAAVTSEVLGRRPDGSPRVIVLTTDPQGTAVERAEKIAANGDVPFDFVNASDATPDQLRQMRNFPASNVFVDPAGYLPLKKGWTPQSDDPDPLRDDDEGDMMRAILDSADDAIVPMLPEYDSIHPTAFTIEHVLKPRNIPFTIVINKWNASEGPAYITQIRQWAEANGYPVAHTVVRAYRVHSNAGALGKVVTQYNNNRTELQAREDFYKLAMEHGLDAARIRVAEIKQQQADLEGAGA